MTQDEVRALFNSRFKGVCKIKGCDRWDAYITAKGETIRLGRFRSEIEAARAYDSAAVYYFGEFAKTNFPASEARRYEPRPRRRYYRSRG